MRWALVFVSLMWLVDMAAADDGPPSDEYAHSATTLYLASTWSPGPTVPIRIGAESALRVHYRHFAAEARVGIGGAGSITAAGSQVVGHLGGSFGVAIPLGTRIVVSPMAGYDVFALWEDQGANVVVHYVTLEIPIAFLLRRGVVIEPFGQFGFARYGAATDPAIVVGPRLGIVF